MERFLWFEIKISLTQEIMDSILITKITRRAWGIFNHKQEIFQHKQKLGLTVFVRKLVVFNQTR